MSEKVVLDSIDKAILRSLQNNGRIANKDLAAAVGVAPSTCMSRVDRLRRTGVVTGFSVDVDPAAIGRAIEALLDVQLQPHARPVIDPFITHVRSLPEVRAVHHVTGPSDFVVHVACGSSLDLQRLVLDAFTARPEVARVETHLIFSTWKGSPLTPFEG
ncbi:MAG TPA: Lrp/AsnC family transcriptional regulator [Actinocrinis sp.]|jgi:DNA-binding Lrp family transcriptional regulator|uniref:Lrp/AsnC family transcriptional regulator n=1 Tax=Actinocrinis sp. TaxID=1920516 RepID=UPI002DDDB146|nr:Lrp/AsnC family transcriptional regulator [Actinocrinis sp.]HEV3168926.1 Lrp/AsnC family transcriptional regulator [Actinocrinis sp.]